jgi:hypothetical protein
MIAGIIKTTDKPFLFSLTFFKVDFLFFCAQCLPNSVKTEHNSIFLNKQLGLAKVKFIYSQIYCFLLYKILKAQPQLKPYRVKDGSDPLCSSEIKIVVQPDAAATEVKAGACKTPPDKIKGIRVFCF